ncbi:4-hydroxyphenylacetate catabolism regulator HpaA [Xanthomonas cucurbitae]|uniref:4-hydroxyphenylacetate catabolism regulator HpaA n=2 Tax=Xanthomonas TaxID=338 RepID=A0A2S7DF58_9XANT|nr:hypothetical protein XcuCFBP2542_17175 [Xanthomonas cucurbitae]WDM67239.1 4-hydroxyphenylacetate catabolism regulator HpaA [Xanthomonas cucurbitae]WDM71117.1 4-hydroxyphenylacetate catabolism regulator HpaA [Xanthomonas cucurbitae]WDM79611.1 4-hydroxyphenylacetate catabolism regulator HpaA [Xanthomonas cucurbitae]WDM83301.1 4-hydroxyphenylacetate catabolism regulator HpaA [Xanthomonas cucurbitae]
MIRRLPSTGSVLPTAPAQPQTSMDVPHAEVPQAADTIHHRLRPAPSPRRRRRGMGALDGMDEGFDAAELQEAEAARVSALRGRVKVVAAPSQDNKHDGQRDENSSGHDGDPQSAQRPLASIDPSNLEILSHIDGILDRYVQACTSNEAASSNALVIALAEFRAIKLAHPESAPLTTIVWRLMRDHLRHCSSSPPQETLRALRERLLTLITPESNASSALRSFHLLIPLMLLNAQRPRRLRDRIGAVKRLNALMKERSDSSYEEIRS